MAPKTFVNVNTTKDLDDVAREVAKETGTEGQISIINSNLTHRDEGVIVTFFDSEGNEPLTVETPFRIER